jgi:nucleotide-binding universal stress UspA family protein
MIDELSLEDEGSLFEIDIESEASDDDPVTALIDAARRRDARAIIVGRDQHSRLHKTLGNAET